MVTCEEDLSRGFCAASIDAHFNRSEYKEYKKYYLPVHLQVVDVQRFPIKPIKHEASRFYLAASDGEKLIWVVISPQTCIEAKVASGELEIGCLITFFDFTLVEAANGKNVVIVNELLFSKHPELLLCKPKVDTRLFHLSSAALIAPSIHLEDKLSYMKKLTLEEIIRAPDCALSPFFMFLKVVLLPLREFCPSSLGVSTPINNKMVETVMMDINGCAIRCFVPWNEKLEKDSVWCCVKGQVVWGQGKAAVPSHLVFPDVDGISPSIHLEGAPEASDFPQYPLAVASGLSTLSSIINLISLPAMPYASVVGRIVLVHEVKILRTRASGTCCLREITISDGKKDGVKLRVCLFGKLSSVKHNCGSCCWFYNFIVKTWKGNFYLSSREPSFVVQLDFNFISGEHLLFRKREREISPEKVSTSLRVSTFSECSPTLPILGEVRNSKKPIFWNRCEECKATCPAVPRYERKSCKCSEVSFRFQVVIALSDEHYVSTAVCSRSASEFLFDKSLESIEELFSQAESTKDAEEKIYKPLIGKRFLCWLLPYSGDNASYLITKCEPQPSAMVAVE